MENVSITKKYVVYKLNSIMDSDKHLALEEANIGGLVSNWFDSENEAIKALIESEMFYRDYLILPRIYITKD